MKAWKLQECVAHSPGSITCVSLGRQSGRVMATGGEDRRVKLWAVGKPTCILSLTGHTSSVEATEFSHDEGRVAAGSLSGSLRIWDLEEVKIIRALSGHTSGIRSLDFHPFGNFIASGSTDTSVKLWDVSRKGCINTYRGHTNAINTVRFSPDGKWVVSGGDDGSVKLWDLVAGRQLADLTGHIGAVSVVAFHPTVLLLATASSVDKTVRLFDLENFTQISVSGAELTGSVIRRIVFHPDGVCLYVATTDFLKVYNYETLACMETIQVGWRTGGGLDDMAIAPSFNQLVGASMNNSMLTTYVVDVKSCIPFVGDQQSGNADSSSLAASTQSSSVCTDTSATTVVCDRLSQQQPSGEPNAHIKQSDVRQPPSTNSASQPKHRKSFCRDADSSGQSALQEDPSDPDSQQPYKPSADEQSECVNIADINDPEEYDRVFKPRRTVARSPSRQDVTVEKDVIPPRGAPDSFPAPSAVGGDPKFNPTPSPPPPYRDQPSKPSSVSARPTSPIQLGTLFEPPRVGFNKLAPKPPSKRTPPPPTTCEPSEDIITSFTKHVTTNPAVSTTPERSESDWLFAVRKPHSSFLSVMTSRVKALSTVRMMWTRDNIRTAVEATLSLDEPTVLVDILGILSQNNKLWNLELACLILPHLLPLMKSKYTRHVETTCQAVHMILKNFAQLIRQTLDGPAAPGVDLMRDERVRKCQTCMDHLQSIQNALISKDVSSRAGKYGRELSVCFQLLA